MENASVLPGELLEAGGDKPMNHGAGQRSRKSFPECVLDDRHLTVRETRAVFHNEA